MSESSKKSAAYVLITPARNEQSNIGRLIESMIKQTHLPLRWVIVNDGSADETAAIVKPYCQTHPWIELVDLPARRDRTFAAKVHSFNAGYDRIRDLDWEVVANLDADLSFEPDYLEFLMTKFAQDTDLGVAGTIFREPGYSSETNSFEGQNHVAGGCQMFRRACFEEVGGYVPNRAGGIDWIAVTTARMKGWKTRSYREKYFFHHRALGTAERGRLASAFSYGEKDYYLGGGLLWESFRVVYQMKKSPFILAGLALGAGYMSAAARRMKRPVSPELMRFHRSEQTTKLKAILSSLIRFRRLDSFQVMPAAGRQNQR
jgi:glycosyltransferase involved in cell wall biosynthesis